jgi:LDH2 family malate/lactate/ureidoglycolate dehydrogenase
MSTVDRDSLVRWARAALEAVGAPPPAAEQVAASLVESDLRGYASHGVLRLPAYVAEVREGVLRPDAQPVISGAGGAFTVDGGDAFGQLTARVAADELARRAGSAGVAFAVARRCRHVGRLGEYVERLAARGFIAFAAVSSEPLVAAPGGRTRLMGTNPHAWAFPGGGGRPIVADFATSAVSAGRVLAARANGQLLPEGQVIDRHGEPTTNPGDLLDGGALLPFGGHKGFALGLVADILAGILSGAGSGNSPGYTGAHGLAMLAIDVGAFAGPEDFGEQIEALRRRIAASGEAVLPGDGSAARRSRALNEGIRIPASTQRELAALSRDLRIAEPGRW